MNVIGCVCDFNRHASDKDRCGMTERSDVWEVVSYHVHVAAEERMRRYLQRY